MISDDESYFSCRNSTKKTLDGTFGAWYSTTYTVAPAPPAAASLSATMTMAPADLRTMQRATAYSVWYTRRIKIKK